MRNVATEALAASPDAGKDAALPADVQKDAEDAKLYRWLLSQMQVGAVSTQLPLYRTLHWIGYEPCSNVADADAAIRAAIAAAEAKRGE
jgi:hypothetical protein